MNIHKIYRSFCHLIQYANMKNMDCHQCKYLHKITGRMVHESSIINGNITCIYGGINNPTNCVHCRITGRYAGKYIPLHIWGSNIYKLSNIVFEFMLVTC